MVLTGLAHAQRMAQVPGVVVPDSVLQRLATKSDPADQARIGWEITAEQIQWVKREGWAGLYLMAPVGPVGVLDVLRAGLA